MRVAAKTWFITGTSTGLGNAWAIAALERGDRVAGTARDLARLADLYEADERFRASFEAEAPGLARFVVAAFRHGRGEGTT